MGEVERRNCESQELCDFLAWNCLAHQEKQRHRKHPDTHSGLDMQWETHMRYLLQFGEHWHLYETTGPYPLREALFWPFCR